MSLDAAKKIPLCKTQGDFDMIFSVYQSVIFLISSDVSAIISLSSFTVAIFV